MALGNCRECGKEVSSEAKVCPNCGVAKPGRNTSPGVRWALLLALVVVVGVIASLSGPATPSTTAPTINAAAPGSDSIVAPYRTYIGAAGGYLSTANQQGTTLAYTMAGLQNGSTTLGELKDTLEHVREIENVGYQGDYVANVNGNIPTLFASDAPKIDEIHRLFRAATTECLQYWNDQDVAHVESCTQSLKRNAVALNAEINAFARKVHGLAAAQNARHTKGASK